MTTANITLAPANLALRGVAGDPFTVYLDLALTDASGQSLSASVISNPAVQVVNSFYISQPTCLPAITATNASVYAVSWTAAQTQQMADTGTSHWGFSINISGVGPYSLVAGTVLMTPQTFPGSATSTSASVAVAVGLTTANVSVTCAGPSQNGTSGQDITVNSGPVASGLLPLLITDQPVVPASGIIQPRPPLVGRTFPNTPVTYNPSGIVSPYGICAGPDGNLWVTDNDGDSVYQLTPTGTSTPVVLTDEPGVYGICAGPDGNLWIPGNQQQGIWRVTPAGIATFFALTGAVGLWACAGPDGNIWMADGYDGVWQVTTAGVGTQFVMPTSDPAVVNIPVALGPICAGPDGNIWATDFSGNFPGPGKVGNNPGVWRITPAGDGTFIDLGTPYPNYICTGPDGNIWVADGGLPGVQRVDPTTGASTPFTLEGSNPNAVVSGSGGDIWVTDNTGALWKVPVNGAGIVKFTLGVTPGALCAGPDGGLWIVDSSASPPAVYNEPFTALTGQLQLTAGPLTTRVLTTSGAYAMTGTESTILADGAQTLPNPADFVGAQFTIKDNGSGTASVLPFGSETIDGAASIPLSTAYEGIEVTTDGTNWYVIGQVDAIEGFPLPSGSPTLSGC